MCYCIIDLIDFNFFDLNKAQFYKMPYRDSSHYEIEILVSFFYLNMLEPNEYTED